MKSPHLPKLPSSISSLTPYRKPPPPPSICNKYLPHLLLTSSPSRSLPPPPHLPKLLINMTTSLPSKRPPSITSLSQNDAIQSSGRLTFQNQHRQSPHLPKSPPQSLRLPDSPPSIFLPSKKTPLQFPRHPKLIHNLLTFQMTPSISLLGQNDPL
jgi:hypothetical protein